MASRPTLIDIPPAPSDPVTPSDMPGTPNSGTTTMSELSTVAIKDGHRGHMPHTSRSHGPEPAAERADRISRLAGLERLGARQPPPIANLTPGAAAAPTATSGYYDGRERSTVGSASATGSVGGRTTWASGSASAEDEDMESLGGLSDDANASLVAFGEGARTPARLPVAAQGGVYASPVAAGRTPLATTGVHEGRSIDGVAMEERQAAERIVNARIGTEGGMEAPGGAAGGLGRFEFEGK